MTGVRSACFADAVHIGGVEDRADNVEARPDIRTGIDDENADRLTGLHMDGISPLWSRIGGMTLQHR
jgi:hypothetical protein